MEQKRPKITQKKYLIRARPAFPGFPPNHAMRPTDNDPKGNDPVDRNPTNEEIVHYLQRGSMRFCPLLLRHVGKPTFEFELRTNFFQGMMHHFKAMFVDLSPTSKVLCTTSAEEFDKYPRANALKSLLLNKCFHSVEAFTVACRNALGDNIEAFDLAGCIFVEGQCVDEAIDAADAAAAAAALKATEEKNLAAEVEKLQMQMHIMFQLVTKLVEHAGEHES